MACDNCGGTVGAFTYKLAETVPIKLCLSCLDLWTEYSSETDDWLNVLAADAKHQVLMCRAGIGDIPSNDEFLEVYIERDKAKIAFENLAILFVIACSERLKAKRAKQRSRGFLSFWR